MKKNNVSNLILTGLVLVALGVGVMLVRQTQELRKGAAFTSASLNLWPSEKIYVKVGEEIPVRARFQADEGKLVDAVQAIVCHDGHLKLDNVVSAGDFNPDPITGTKTVDGKQCVVAVFTAIKPATELKNAADLGTINFIADKMGSGDIVIKTSNSMVTGENPGSLDKEMSISMAEGTSYEIYDEVVGGETPVFNYQLAFNGILKGNKCADNMKARLMVSAVGESRVYSNVELVRTDKVNSKGYSIYEGTAVLAGFNAKNGVAAFFKGSKHLQKKYSVNNQKEFYGKAGGELVLTNNKDTSVKYNFSEYPVLAGDVNQDGRINAEDFSLEKNKAQTHVTVAESDADAQYDLDGSCQLNSLDILLLVKSLDEKQEEIY